MWQWAVVGGSGWQWVQFAIARGLPHWDGAHAARKQIPSRDFTATLKGNPKPCGKGDVCLGCGAPPTGTPMVCASCMRKTASCCSKGCQKRHWKEGHKAECRKIQIRLDVVGAGAAEAAADASNRACGASDHRNLGFASVSDKEMLDFDQHTFSLGWLIDRKDCRLKHVHGASWIDVVGSTMGSKVAPMTTGKLPDRNGDFVQTATELTESRRSVKIGMMDAFADGHDMFNKGDHRGGMAAANNGAYLSWIACEVSATVQFLILMSSCFTRMVQHTDAVRYAQAAVQATGVEGLRLHDHGIVSFAAAPPTSRADLSKDQIDFLVNLAVRDGVAGDRAVAQTDLLEDIQSAGLVEELRDLIFQDIRVPGMANPPSSCPARLTAHCASGACLALGNAYSAALQHDKAVAAHRAGLLAIECMPEIETWDHIRMMLHSNIGNQCK